MKKLLSLFILSLWLSSLVHGQGVTMPVLSQTATAPVVPNIGTINLYKRADGFFYQKSKLGAEESLKIDPKASSVPTYVSTISDLTALGSASAQSVHVRDARRGGLFVYAPTGYTVNSGTVFPAADGGFWVRPYSAMISPDWFGAIPDDNNDDADAIQAAIDATCNTVNGSRRQGRTILFSDGTYLVNSTLNLSNTRATLTLQKDGVHLVGQGINRTIIQGKTGDGHAIIDVSGSQWLHIQNIQFMTDGSSGSSTIGLYSGLFSALQQTQNQHYDAIAITMHSNTTANSGLGTVAYWNFGSEENTHHAVYYSANSPSVITAYSSQPASYSYAFSALASSHSLGVTTFSGECFFEARGSVRPAFELIDVNSIRGGNLYISGSVEAGVTPTQFQAFRIRGGAPNLEVGGTIEGFSGIAQVYGRAVNSTLSFQLGNTNASGQAVFQLEHGAEGILDKCTIRANMSQDLTRPFWNVTTTSANQVASCYVRDTDIFASDSLKYLALPEKLVFNAQTTGVVLHSSDRPALSYYTGQQVTTIPTMKVRGFPADTAATTVARITLPTAITNTSAQMLSVKIDGMAANNAYGSSSSVALLWNGALPILTSNTGTPTVGTPVPVNVAAMASNPTGNNLTGITLSGTVSGNTVLIKLSPVVSGTLPESVYFTGKITLYWMGHSCNGPTLTY